jgi:predicted phosphodiesterase
MSKIKILHLSDLHYDSSKPKDTKIVLDALWKDLDKFPAIDFILFSGDLVKAGDKKEDFEKAYQVFIKPLLEKTNLDESSFFIAPGNHDIQMNAIDRIIDKGLSEELVDRESLNSFLDSQLEKGFPHIERLDHFNNFKTRFNTGSTKIFNKLFSTHVFEKDNTKFGIACLNSSWRATGNPKGDDKGRLLIGERQIDESLRGIEEYDIKIALFHHSLDWLTEYDLSDAKKRLSQKFDLLFCGHLHDPNLEFVQTYRNKALLIQGGSLYKVRSHYNGYSVLSFDDQDGKGTVYLRSYFDDRGGFDKAVNKCEEGEIPIVIKKERFNERVGNDIRQNKAQEKENTLIRYILWQTRGRDSKILDELVRIIEEVIPYPDGRTINGPSKIYNGELYSIEYLREKVITEFDIEKSKSEQSDQGQDKMDRYQRNYLFLHISLIIYKESSVPSKDAAWCALKILEDAQRKFPGYPEIEYLLARLFYIGDCYDEARKAISRFYRVNKDDASPLITQIAEIQKVIDKKGNPVKELKWTPLSRQK